MVRHLSVAPSRWGTNIFKLGQVALVAACPSLLGDAAWTGYRVLGQIAYRICALLRASRRRRLSILIEARADATPTRRPMLVGVREGRHVNLDQHRSNLRHGSGAWRYNRQLHLCRLHVSILLPGMPRRIPKGSEHLCRLPGPQPESPCGSSLPIPARFLAA